MQLEFGESEARTGRRSNRASGIRLTERDCEVIKFVTEMKFATVDEIHEKFFRVTIAGGISQSKMWALNRLHALRRSGFLNAVRYYGEWKAVYLPTFRGYYAMTGGMPSIEVPKPLLRLETRTFVHDRYVLLSRLRFERELSSVEWISERSLKSGLHETFGLSSAHVPDGIYSLPNGERVAFELEIAQKSKSRYRDKISRYAYLIRERKSDPKMFRRVHYVCVRRHVYDFLRAETEILSDLFNVELLEADQSALGA